MLEAKTVLSLEYSVTRSNQKTAEKPLEITCIVIKRFTHMLYTLQKNISSHSCGIKAGLYCQDIFTYTLKTGDCK